MCVEGPKGVRPDVGEGISSVRVPIAMGLDHPQGPRVGVGSERVGREMGPMFYYSRLVGVLVSLRDFGYSGPPLYP